MSRTQLVVLALLAALLFLWWRNRGGASAAFMRNATYDDTTGRYV